MSKELLAEARDDRDIVEIMKAERSFLEKGGYGAVRTRGFRLQYFKTLRVVYVFHVAIPTTPAD